MTCLRAHGGQWTRTQISWLPVRWSLCYIWRSWNEFDTVNTGRFYNLEHRVVFQIIDLFLAENRHSGQWGDHPWWEGAVNWEQNCTVLLEGDISYSEHILLEEQPMDSHPPQPHTQIQWLCPVRQILRKPSKAGWLIKHFITKRRGWVHKVQFTVTTSNLGDDELVQDFKKVAVESEMCFILTFLAPV